MPEPRQRFLIEVEAAPGTDVPVINRLRSWLKSGLRTYALKCVSAREIPAANQGQADAGAGPANEESGTT